MLSVDRFNLAFLSKRYRCDWDRAELLDHETALDHDIHPVDSLYIVLEGTIFPDNDKAWAVFRNLSSVQELRCRIYWLVQCLIRVDTIK